MRASVSLLARLSVWLSLWNRLASVAAKHTNILTLNTMMMMTHATYAWPNNSISRCSHRSAGTDLPLHVYRREQTDASEHIKLYCVRGKGCTSTVWTYRSRMQTHNKKTNSAHHVMSMKKNSCFDIRSFHEFFSWRNFLCATYFSAAKFLLERSLQMSYRAIHSLPTTRLYHTHSK